MPERPIGTALKAVVGRPTAGSNPAPSAKQERAQRALRRPRGRRPGVAAASSERAGGRCAGHLLPGVECGCAPLAGVSSYATRVGGAQPTSPARRWLGHRPSGRSRRLAGVTWFASPDDASARLHATGYLADAATATTAYLAGALEKPLLVEGPAGVGKTELAKAVARATGRRAGAAAVLRGPRRGAGALRVELQEAAAPHPGERRRGVGRDPRRHLHRRVPADPPAADRDPARGADGAARRRGRQDRRRGRGAAAGGARRTSR